MRWVVESVPTWLTGAVLILGLPALAIGAKHYMNAKRRWLSSDSHNDVAGFQAAIVAVVYAVVVGFTIIALYEASAAASNDVSTEAADLLQLHTGNAVFGPTMSRRIDADVLVYAHSVVDNWTTISEGNASSQVTRSLNEIYATFDAYTPRTAAQTDYLQQSISDLDNLSQARVARQLEAQEAGSLPAVLWIAILVTSLVTLAYALIFTLENPRLAYLMVGGVAAVLAVNVFVTIELGYPFIGSVAVGPGKFIDVIHLVTG